MHKRFLGRFVAGPSVLPVILGPHVGHVACACRTADGVPGVLLENLSPTAAARLDHAHLWLGGAPVSVSVAGGDDEETVPGYPADRLDRIAALGADFAAAVLREVMARFRRTGPQALRKLLPGMERRAAAFCRGTASGGPATLRSTRGAEDIAALHRHDAYTGFFTLTEARFRFRRFDGGFSELVDRSALGVGDGATVLPYDPVHDTVLLIEQMRIGPLLRGEVNVWSLETVAGLCDPGETPDVTARREAQEEGGVTIHRLAEVASFYPAAGAGTEFMTVFIGEADLSRAGGVFGVAQENEDIRTMVVSTETALAALASGEVRNAPLVVALQGLDTQRARLRAAWNGQGT